MKPTDGHPPIHALGELAEGVLEPAQAAAARAHVDACPECQDSLASLGTVTSLLRSAPSVPIPAAVSARIAAALAAEADAASSPAAHGLSVVGASPADRDEATGTVAWFRRRMPQALAAAASVAVVALGGYVVTTGGQSDSGGDVPAAGAASDDQAVAPNPSSEAGDGAVEQDAPHTYDNLDPAVGDLAVEAAIADVWNSRASLAEGCGATLAAATGDTLVGSADHAESVLVVVESSTGELTGWLVPDCGASTDQAIGEPVTIPTP